MIAFSLVLNLIVMLGCLGFFLYRRNPGLARRLERVEVVADLDAIMSRTVGFKFNGRTFKIPPIASTNFFYAMNAMAELEVLKVKERISDGELLDKYDALFSIVCPSIKRSDIEQMSHQQVGAVWNLIIAQIMGKTRLDEEKKSPLTA